MEDLESDPFVDHALTSTACELYYRYGKLLAPITAALTTVKYCRFGHQCPRRIEEDGLERQQCDSTHTNAGGLAGGCRGANLRVTAETTPAPSRSPRQKDEKKAAAGRTGAAARKAKTKRLEGELATAKEALRDSAFVSAPAAPLLDAHSNEEAPRRGDKEAAGSMTP